MDDLNQQGEGGVRIEELLIGSDRPLADQVAARSSAVLPADQAALVSAAVYRAVARVTDGS